MGRHPPVHGTDLGDAEEGLGIPREVLKQVAHVRNRPQVDDLLI